MQRINDILNFWFSGLNDNELIDKKDPRVKRWFTKDRAFDEDIRNRFEEDLIKAAKGVYKDWEEAPQGRLALVILFDQLSRNIYRDSPQMFAYDPLALNLTLVSLKDSSDQKLQLIERLFLYMPLMHTEDLTHQELSLKQFSELVTASKARCPQNTPYFEYTLNYAVQHHKIIERFSRFPHRNAILNRPSSEEEIMFLQKPGSNF